MALAVIRVRSGHTQKSLAKAVDVHPSYIGQVEAGHGPCSDDVLMRIAAELGVGVEAIAYVAEEAK